MMLKLKIIVRNFVLVISLFEWYSLGEKFIAISVLHSWLTAGSVKEKHVHPCADWLFRCFQRPAIIKRNIFTVDEFNTTVIQLWVPTSYCKMKITFGVLQPGELILVRVGIMQPAPWKILFFLGGYLLSPLHPHPSSYAVSCCKVQALSWGDEKDIAAVCSQGEWQTDQVLLYVPLKHHTKQLD